MQDVNLDRKSFDAIAQLAYRESGIRLVPEKMSMIKSRLRPRLREMGLQSFETYTDYVCSDDGRNERRQMISALTTNVSHFFRENHHFELLSSKILPSLKSTLDRRGRVRIWSAGCSNGQEAYSVAMCVLQGLPEWQNADIKILATDIDPKVVEFARRGRYSERLTSGIPDQYLKKYFEKTESKGQAEHLVKDPLRSLVVFRELNLLSDWPMKQRFDIVFCRNVVIYFDLETQNRLWPKFHQVLSTDGYLFLGHSERISNPELFGFENDGPTTYRATGRTT